MGWLNVLLFMQIYNASCLGYLPRCSTNTLFLVPALWNFAMFFLYSRWSIWASDFRLYKATCILHMIATSILCIPLHPRFHIAYISSKNWVSGTLCIMLNFTIWWENVSSRWWLDFCLFRRLPLLAMYSIVRFNPYIDDQDFNALSNKFAIIVHFRYIVLHRKQNI